MDILSEIKEKREIQLQKEKKLYKKPSFKDALKQEDLKIIGEIKRASPSKGKIADNSFNLLNQAKHYAENGVAAFSILTEYFKGDNEFIKIVSENFPHIPILRKDFIYTPFQVAHAKFLGASAILLIVRMLNDEELHTLHRLAHELDLDVLVEIHDKSELERALKIPDLQILGINNRNLNTFNTDIKTTGELIKFIPEEILKNIVLVSESGFLSKDDLKYAENLNVDALLIGEALMKGLIF